ncbi:MAG: glycoside hydrolase N-terminal domain-containing protein [Clostridia bacterium]|nr:glycoside hydrolase N-terminal domain-containing protein [Clostridia bacterium]
MSRHLYTIDRPASCYGQVWREALPLGNGFTGVLIYGAIAEETVHFNRYDLWENGVDGAVPDMTDTFRKMREDIIHGDYAAANRDNIMYALLGKGYASCTETPFPLGALRLSFSPDNVFKHYRRGIDLQKGEAFVEFCVGEHKYVRKAFVSRDSDITVMRMSADIEFTVKYTPELFGGADSIEMTGNGFRAACAEKETAMNVAFIGDFMSKNVENGVEITGRDYMVLVCCSSHGSHIDLDGYLSETYETLLSKHTALYTPLYDAVDIRLAEEAEFEKSNDKLLDEAFEDRMPAALIERCWRFGRYLFISATAENSYPVHLYGLWFGENKLLWSQYVANENVEMTYWHALPGGLAYALPPLIRYYTSRTAKFRECAKQVFGMNGIWISAYTTPHVGGLSVPVSVISNWISCAGWLCRHFCEYYVYSGDEQLLREEILPFMHETACFYCDYVIFDDGKVQFVPSVSPENTPRNLMELDTQSATGHNCPAAKNATMDFAIMKELLTNLLAGIESTGMYADEADEYRRLLSAIPGYMVNSDGAVKEWMSAELDDNYEHRHLSHIYPVFPGNEVTEDNAPELFAAFRRAVELRELGSQVGWSLTHMANIYARFGLAEKAAECLDVLSKSVLLPNLFTLHNDWRHMGMTLNWKDSAIVCLDAVFGAVSAVQEMVFRYEKDALVILPAVPERVLSGSVRGIVFPGGTADFAWDEGGKIRLTVKAAADIDTKLIIRGIHRERLNLNAGESRTLEFSRD